MCLVFPTYHATNALLAPEGLYSVWVITIRVVRAEPLIMLGPFS